MRLAFDLTNEFTCHDILNPLFDWCTDVICEPLETIEDEEDNEHLQIKFRWYVRPKDFDPERDPVLIYFHGGGFAVKLTPISILFLRNLKKVFPKMVIIISDYTVSDMLNDKKASHRYPMQILESIALYNYVTESIGCKRVIMSGDSAGGNLVAEVLLHLSRNDLKLPHKAILISPWLNPSKIDGHETSTEILDCLSYKALKRFSEAYIPFQYDNREAPLNVECDFDKNNWNIIINETKLFVTYGQDEILRPQIQRFISRLKEMNPSNIYIQGDEKGGHIEPLLSCNFNVELWSKQPTIKGILEFLMS